MWELRLADGCSRRFVYYDEVWRIKHLVAFAGSIGIQIDALLQV
jgi:hypothetical protein